jgi:hypothetical protein
MVPQFILELPTPRLLKYFQKHYRRPSPYADYYGQVDENEQEAHSEWLRERETLRAELSMREHVSNA